MSNEPLRGCPTCGTKVSDVDMGLRDYRWVSSKLPGRVAPMDGDFILERKGKLLIIEFKPKGVEPGVGQSRTLRALKKFADVWVVHGDGPFVDVNFGNGTLFTVTVDELGDEVVLWFEEAGQ